MIRFLFRLIGLVLLAAGFIFLIYDGTRFIADSGVHMTTLDNAWNTVLSTGPEKYRPAIDRIGVPWLWDPVIQSVLKQPTCLILGILGAIFMLLGRTKKKLIGYVRS
ncbi:MAG: hypothetical protein JO010_14525 [Alphaproteobacteria bacterium]|nr:hypothetical protein [Alphaproteobacteria bacterium]